MYLYIVNKAQQIKNNIMTPQDYINNHLNIFSTQETLKIVSEQYNANNTEFLFDSLLFLANIIKNK